MQKSKEKKKFPKSILKYVKRQTGAYIAGIITLFVVDFLNLYITEFTGDIIDGLTLGTLDLTGVLRLVLFIFLAGLGLMAGRFLWRFFIFGSCRKKIGRAHV